MAQDAYAPCPCGSGRKLKFCCGEILPELQRAQRLLDNQPDAAEQILRSLHDQHPDKDSVTSLLAELLQRSGRLDELRDLLIGQLKKHPDHPQLLLSLAELCLIEDGFEASRRLVHRAFQLCVRSHPDAVAMLANRIARELIEAGCHLAVREHLAMSVRVAQGEMRKRAIMMLASFESSTDVPYPFRGGNPLLPVGGAVSTQEQDQRARKLCLLGCFEPAAILYSRLSETDPDNGAVWYNLGMCSAWDARPADAIPALRKAVELLEDRELATEAEALAQLLDDEVSGEKYSVVDLPLKLRSASETLSRLDKSRQLFRAPLDVDDEAAEGAPIARFEILSEPVSSDAPDGPNDLPRVIGEILVFDTVNPDDEDDTPVLEISTGEDLLPLHTALVRSLLGDGITTAADEEEPIVSGRYPIEQQLFDHPIFRPDDMNDKTFRRLRREQLQNAIDEWLDLPHSVLDGATPRAAAQDSSRQIRLKAAVLNLHAYVLRTGESIELGNLLDQLGLPRGDAISVPSSVQLAALPGYRYFRIAPEKLSDTQLADFTNRTTMLSFVEVAKRSLDTIMERPEALQKFGERRAALSRAAIARSDGDYDRAFECFEKAREWTSQDVESFRNLLEIDVRELSCRLDDPSDPKLIELLHRFRDRYLRKIPEIGEIVRQQLEDSGCQHLIAELGDAVTVGSQSQLWTGSEPPAESEPQKKLWLPGQD